MTQADYRADAQNCFVCGPKNPIGLKIPFELDGLRCVGQFTAAPEHVGFDGVTHGGIVFSVLDDLMANWIFLQGGKGFTAKCDIRYREPLPVGVTVNLSCEVEQIKRRLVQLSSKATRIDTGNVVAEANASFMVDEFGNIDIS